MSQAITGRIRPGRAPGAITSDVRSPWVLAWRRLRRNGSALVGLAGLLVVLLVTLAAPRLAPYDPIQTDYNHIQEPPSTLHKFGTDDLGRDIFSRVIWGGRESIGAAILAVLVGMFCGILIGLVSGYRGGVIDNIVQRLVDIMLAFPVILLMLSLAAILGKGLLSIILSVGIAYMPGTARFVRGCVLGVRNQDFVEAARAVGVPERRIMLRHVLPNTVSSLIVYTSILLGGAVLVTAGLSYLGLGVAPPSPEWGAMLNYGRNFLRFAWWMSVFPGLAIFIVVMCINLLGDGLRDALDIKGQ